MEEGHPPPPIPYLKGWGSFGGSHRPAFATSPSAASESFSLMCSFMRSCVRICRGPAGFGAADIAPWGSLSRTNRVWNTRDGSSGKHNKAPRESIEPKAGGASSPNGQKRFLLSELRLTPSLNSKRRYAYCSGRPHRNSATQQVQRLGQHAGELRRHVVHALVELPRARGEALAASKVRLLVRRE